MYCRKCGEKNPENAVFCRNCGERLVEEVKKTEVVEAPTYKKESTQNTQTTTTSSDSNSDWLGCCLCLVGIFIIFAIIGSF
jgi:uncharacterized membrane protein YvbJ